MSSPEKAIIRYDGEALKDQAIDVEVFAPSLLAFAKMLKQANYIVNGDKTKLNIKVNNSIEQNCFEILLVADTTIIQQAKDFIFDDNTVVAKELLEWFGIVGVSGSTIIYLIKKLHGKKINKSQISEQDEKGNTTIDFGNNNKLENVNMNIINIYNDKDFRKEAQKALAPLDNDGIDTIEFGEKETPRNAIKKDEYKPFAEYNIDNEATKEFEPQITERYLTIHSPNFDESSKIWGFVLSDVKINVDISETDIVQQAIKRGKVHIGDTYKVMLEETQYKTPKGQFRTKYKILEVIGFVAGEEQDEMDA